MRKRILYNLLLFIVGFVLLNSCEKLQEDFNQVHYKNPIKIGVVGDLAFGREVVENIFFSVKLAADEINKKGGLTINGTDREIQLIFKNSGGNPEIGLQIVSELIDEEVEIIIGPTNSEVAVGMAAKCIENNILMMSYSATVPDLSYLNDKDLVWRTCPSDAFSGDVMAKYTADSLQIRKGAILYRDDKFGRGMRDVIKTKFEKMDAKIVATAGFPTEGVDLYQYDYSPHIDLLLDQQPQVIFTIIFEPEVGKITRDFWSSTLYQNYERKPYLFLAEGGFVKELETNGQPEVIKSIIGISSSITNTSNYQAFKNMYIEKNGFNPVTYAEHAYDALYSIAYAMQKGQSVNPMLIKHNLRLVSGGTGSNPEAVIVNVNEFERAKILIESNVEINYNGASGSISFDQNGDPKSTFVIWVIEDGVYKEISYLDR